jgi:WD40 repeat protein
MLSAEFVGDGREVLTAQADGTVAFWDLATQEKSRTCCTVNADDGGIWPPTWAEAVPSHPDRAVIAYEDQSVHVWDLSAGEGGTDVQTFKEGAVIGFAISPDGSTIVTVGRDDKLARVWRADWALNTFQQVGGWSSGLVSSLDFSPDGSRVVMGGLDGVVRVWDVSSGKQVIHERDDEMRVPGGAVSAATFNSDGTWVLAGGSDGVVRIWDATNASFLADLPVHAGSVNSIDTFTGGRIATASDDYSAKVFECTTCGPITDVVKLARDQAAVDPMDMAH